MIEGTAPEVHGMADNFVTVATYAQSFEAQMAKNLLENEGIASIVSGEVTADMLPLGQGGGKDQIVLQVNENDAQRAAGILAVVAAAKLDDNWEDQAESGAGVWICSICGEPISNRLSVCFSCQTPREGIRATLPRDPTAIQPDPSTLGTDQQVQKRDEIANAPAPLPSLAAPHSAAPPEDEIAEQPFARGDDLARRAFLAAVFGFLFLPLSWYFLGKLFFSDYDFSPRGSRHVYGALLVNGALLFVVFILYLLVVGVFR
jgi:hypothetical protein